MKLFLLVFLFRDKKDWEKAKKPLKSPLKPNEFLENQTFFGQNPIFAKIVGIKEITVKSVDGKITHKLTNVNKLLGSVEGVLGVKTGWTENARENLVTEVSRNGKRVMIVVLGSSDRFGETTELIDWIYNNYSWENVIPS